MCSIAVFFLILGGPFIAVVQVSVYAGAIMVLFLFVIMLLGAEHTPGEQNSALAAGRRPSSLPSCCWADGLHSLANSSVDRSGDRPQPRSLGCVESIGLLLYSVYLFPFEVTSVLLLVALVGAVVMTRDTK